MILAYFLIALGATTLGSMAGLGGGVIIKPILDFLGDYNLSTISVLSSFTVLSMAIISIVKQLKYKFIFNTKKTLFIGIGSILGGFIGEKALKLFIILSNASTVTTIQNLILVLLLVLVFIYINNRSKFTNYNINNLTICTFIGLTLGLISSFLSIGGGPINVCIFALFFSMDEKESSINSIITILFSQVSKLLTIATTTGFTSFDLGMLPYMILGGVLGGLIGSNFNRKCSNKIILIVFNIVVLSLIILNIFNILSYI